MINLPTWYDVLGVPRDASSEEVRAAWKSQIADLEPGDRRFDALNRAAKVLLDPAARAAYDAEHPRVDDEDPGSVEVDARAPAESLVDEGAPAPVGKPTSESSPNARLRRSWTTDDESSSTTGSGGVPSWLLAGLGLLAAGLVAVTTWMWSTGDDGGDDSAAREAQVAAERAVVPLLSYDYRHMEEDQRAAQALMTGNYRDKYDPLFSVLVDNAPATQAVVTVEIVSSAIVRASDDRVEVLLFIDRPTTNKLEAEPFVSRDMATLFMQRVDGEWLVDDVDAPAVQD